MYMYTGIVHSVQESVYSNYGWNKDFAILIYLKKVLVIIICLKRDLNILVCRGHSCHDLLITPWIIDIPRYLHIYLLCTQQLNMFAMPQVSLCSPSMYTTIEYVRYAS